jgi:hypothetical protein
MATNKTKKLKYGELAEGNTPEATNTPQAAVPGQSALVSAGYGTGMTPDVGAGARTAISYGEFMARKNAAELASALESGNVGAGAATGAATGATYAQGTGTQPPAGWNSGISFAPSATEGGTEAPTSDGKTVRDLIEEQRQASYADAEAARERATVDAMTSYQKNLATYGTKAENLASGGLSGSGYGEYLQGQAYAQQRADIQAAARGEAAAKREADRVYYADMMVQTEKDNATYASLLDEAKSGNYTADEIGNLAAKYGITDESDLAMLKSAAENESAKKEKSDIAGNVTADMSDEKIAELYPNSQEEAKAQRTEAALDDIDGYVNANNWEGARNAVEKHYESGAIGDDDRQSFYLQDALSDIDVAAKDGKITDEIGVIAGELAKAKNNGKISEDDYRKAMQYASEKATSVLISGDTSNFTQEVTDWGNEFSITINGKEYKGGLVAEASDDADGNIQNILNNAMGGHPKKGSIALYDDGVYVYAKVDGKAAWYKASRNMWGAGNNIKFATDNKNIYEALQAAARTRKDPTKPEHTAG